MSWPRFLEAERCINIFLNITNWKDSAVEETFHNAKKRFWANINGLDCDIPLPDPDIHNDIINQNNDDVDPELILDLDYEFVVPNDQEGGGNHCDLHDPYAGYPIGWGDLDDIPTAKNNVVEPLPPTGWREGSNEPIPVTGIGKGSIVQIPTIGWGYDFNEPIPATRSGEASKVTRLGESYKYIVATGWGDDNNYVTENIDYGSYNHIIATGWFCVCCNGMQ
ncbi:uncharacterized protein LOC124909867 [Impatiens glandulifera]|uniref:uncharacterized protein LOC124909867 n=1 Tax=Impatiens glandulifera TaxID=253017 RepID=UPI001FB12683|nr:uncharacterized protein LOC124909867 [Impatiens glandulifera]